MTPEFHAALRTLLLQMGRIDPRDVDVRFEAPTRDWIERLTRPTVNFFLFDLKENIDLRETTFRVTRQNGIATRRQAPRRIDLHYMVSALTTEIDDEHLLLWRTLATLMKYPEVPDEVLPESIRGIQPALTTRVTQPDEGQRLIDVWSALNTPPRPALYYVLTVPLDLDRVTETPLILTRTARYTHLQETVEPEIRTNIGGVVRSSNGDPVGGIEIRLAGSSAEPSVTSSDGSYRLRNVRAGEVVLLATPFGGTAQTVTFQVPAESYDITLN